MDPLIHSTFFEQSSSEFSLESAQQKSRLLDEADHCVGCGFRRLVFDIGLISLIRPIRPIGKPPDEDRLLIVFRPSRESALAQEVFVIDAKFLKASSEGSDGVAE